MADIVENMNEDTEATVEKTENVEIEAENAEVAATAENEEAPIGFKNKVKAFLHRHQNIFQIIKFTLISCIAFLAEFAVMYALQYGLLGVYGDVEFKWFLFHYAPGKTGAFGLAGFIAMLGSKCVAEIISFTINRKKTFNANNNVIFSAIMYAITVVAIILLSTWLAGALGSVLGGAIGADWGNTISKLLGSFLSWVIMFLMDKFVIMRNVDKGEKDAEQADANAAIAENADSLENALADDSEAVADKAE